MTVHYSGSETGGNHQEDPRRPKRPILKSMMRGAFNRCPNCGEGRMFSGFLSTNTVCGTCGTELHHHRADDAPPYFTITIVGHIIIAGLLYVEIMYRPPIWLHLSIWLPLTLILSFGLMRPIKGALIGLQWALYMHGFDPDFEDEFAVGSTSGEDRRG